MVTLDPEYIASGEWIYTYDFVAFTGAIVFVFVSLVLARAGKLRIESEILVSSARCFVQLLILGSIFIFIFEYKNGMVSVLALSIMVFFGTYTAASRSKGLPGATKVAGTSLTVGTLAVLPFMTLLGITPFRSPEILIPLGAMAVGNGMNRVSLSMDRLRSEVKGNVMKIESALALGAPGDMAIGEHLRNSARSALIPTLDNLKTMGIVWIPGAMTGLLLAGADPLHAAIIQIVVMTMILTIGLVTSLVSTHMMGKLLFTDSQQLRDLSDIGFGNGDRKVSRTDTDRSSGDDEMGPRKS